MEEGAASLTTTVIVAVALPPVLVAVTVYVAEDVIVVGVPEMAPVDVSNDRPDGRVGDISHETTAPPLEVGVTAVMVKSLFSERELGL